MGVVWPAIGATSAMDHIAGWTPHSVIRGISLSLPPLTMVDPRAIWPVLRDGWLSQIPVAVTLAGSLPANMAVGFAAGMPSHYLWPGDANARGRYL